jgi:L-asparaginase
VVDSISNQKIFVLGTGGTIAGQSSLVNDNIGYVAAQVGVAALAAAIPGLAEHTHGYELVFEQVAQVDSKDMDFAVWVALAQRTAQVLMLTDVKGVVITHGTDTIEETAYFLESVLRVSKPVVLTCAMRPASALNPDGPQNMLDALSLAMHPHASGVAVVCAGVVHSAAHVQKIHPYRLDAFSSGEVGPLGWVEEGKVRWALADGARIQPQADTLSMVHALPVPDQWPAVEIVLNHVGAAGTVVDALVHAGVRGIVVACTGNGTLSRKMQASLEKAMAAGTRVVRSTRCPLGQVIAVPGAQIPDAKGLSPVKARIALLLSLMGLSSGL